MSALLLGYNQHLIPLTIRNSWKNVKSDTLRNPLEKDQKRYIERQIGSKHKNEEENKSKDRKQSIKAEFSLLNTEWDKEISPKQGDKKSQEEG